MYNNIYELRTDIQTIISSENVYFNPPEKHKITYPAALIQLNDISTQHGSNIRYTSFYQYKITLITLTEPLEFIKKILELPYCSYNTSFISDKLYHTVFTIYIS